MSVGLIFTDSNLVSALFLDEYTGKKTFRIFRKILKIPEKSSKFPIIPHGIIDDLA